MIPLHKDIAFGSATGPRERIAEIEEEIRQIEGRMQALRRELEELRRVPVREPVHQPSGGLLTPDEKVALFLSLFRCRESVFPRLWENSRSGKKGYSPVCLNEWARGICEKPRVKCAECLNQRFPPLDEEAVLAHLMGRQTIGTYAIREDNTCVFLAADFDGDGWEADVTAYRDAAESLGMDVAVERSRSGQGAHGWIFFAAPTPATLARRLGTLITAKASSLHSGMKLATYDRFFPNQDTLPDGGFGNLIALPLQKAPREHGNTVFLDKDLRPIADQWSYLASIRRVAPDTLGRLIETIVGAVKETSSEPQENFSLRFDERVLDILPEAVTRGVFTGTIDVCRNAQIELAVDGLPSCLISAIKRLGTLANPVFYEKQRLRFPTYNIPRFIFSGALRSGVIVLPRGTLPQLKALVRKAGGTLKVSDERPMASKVEFSFAGELTQIQSEAVREVMEHDDGVLMAPPGAGKTVMACSIIAQRETSTLVLVHRKTLLEQWRERIKTFLGLEGSSVPVLGQPGADPVAPVTLGMLQTLIKSEFPEALLAPYSHIVIDECHHVPAASIEAVIKKTQARFILGLTATPVRKDGLQKLLFLQCGPIRHRVEIDGDPTVPRKLIVRDLLLRRDPAESRLPIHLLWEALVNSDERNKAIVADIAGAALEKRFSAVLSDRKEHLLHLETLLKNGIPAEVATVFRIDGSMGKKQREALFSELHRQADAREPFILLATSSLLGEGFDLPELDTLFLAMPISFKGRIIQYAGRLHRQCKGKSEVRVYDYVETDNPLTAHMHRKRLSAFRQMGYELIKEDGNGMFKWD